MTASDDELLDENRTVRLHDVGQPDYVAAIAVSADGAEHAVLAHIGSLGDEHVRYDDTCPDATHEQLGQLPLEYVRRLTISRRRPQ
jgi:hypothetical protein